MDNDFLNDKFEDVKINLLAALLCMILLVCAYLAFCFSISKILEPDGLEIGIESCTHDWHLYDKGGLLYCVYCPVCGMKSQCKPNDWEIYMIDKEYAEGIGE